MIKIFIGYDPIESVAYHTLVQSIIEYTNEPVSITPLNKRMLPMYNRPHDKRESNDFTFTRFLVPYLCNYEGHALFIDCDMMFRASLRELWDLIDSTKCVQVVKHDYTPSTQVKYLGVIQYAYPRKNWSSVMLFNCAKCKRLTPEYVNTATFEDLHQMRWAEKVGGLPYVWNHLVGEYQESPAAKLVHWTIGGPYFSEYAGVEHSTEWFHMKQKMMNCEQVENKDSA